MANRRVRLFRRSVEVQALCVVIIVDKFGGIRTILLKTYLSENS